MRNKRSDQWLVLPSGQWDDRAIRKENTVFRNFINIREIQKIRPPHAVKPVVQLPLKFTQCLFNGIVLLSMDRHIVFAAPQDIGSRKAESASFHLIAKETVIFRFS